MDQIRKLLHAAEQGNMSTASELLNQGVHVDSTDDEGVGALHTAAANGHDNMLCLLLSRGASFDARNCYGWTPLMTGACYGHVKIVMILVQHKANIFAQNDLGATALDCAARSGHFQIVLVLMDASSDYGSPALSMLSDNCLRALLNACHHGHELVVKLLLEKSTDVNHKDPVTGWTPLMFASLNGHISVVQALCEYGANTNATNLLHQTALEIAAIRERTEVEAYLDSRTTTRPQLLGQKTIKPSIIESARSGDVQGVRELLEIDETDVNDTDEDGATPLMFAAIRGHLHVAQLLIANGAHIDSQDKISGWTALMQATYYRHKHVVKLLLDSSADVNVRAEDGYTAFDMASIIGDTDIVRLLASVTMQLPSSHKNRNGILSQSNNEPVKRSSQELSAKDLIKYEGPDNGKTGLKLWWSKVSSRLRNLTLVRTISISSATQNKAIKQELRSTSLTCNELKSSNSLSYENESTSTTKSLVSVVDSALNAGGHSCKRSKTLPLGSLMSRLPDDVISPVVPPTMPSPAFELTRVQVDHSDSEDDDSVLPMVPCLRVNGKFIPDATTANKSLAVSLDNISSVSGYPSHHNHHGNSTGYNFSGSPESSFSAGSLFSSISNTMCSRTLKATVSPQSDALSKQFPLATKMHSKPARPVQSPSPTLISVASAASAPGRLCPSLSVQKTSKLTPVYSSRSDDGVTCCSFTNIVEHVETDEVTDILKKLSLEKYNSMFEEQEVDMEAFLTLNEVDLKDLGVTQKDARQQILSAITELNTGKDRERQHFKESISDGRPSKSQPTSGINLSF